MLYFAIAEELKKVKHSSVPFQFNYFLMDLEATSMDQWWPKWMSLVAMQCTSQAPTYKYITATANTNGGDLQQFQSMVWRSRWTSISLLAEGLFKDNGPPHNLHFYCWFLFEDRTAPLLMLIIQKSRLRNLRIAYCIHFNQTCKSIHVLKLISLRGFEIVRYSMILKDIERYCVGTILVFVLRTLKKEKK